MIRHTICEILRAVLQELLMNRLLCMMALFLLPMAARPQTAPADLWADWRFLLGEWTAGESGGVPGQASKGSFSLAPDLDGKILVRKNHAEYPPANGRPAVVHDDLMIIFREAGVVKAFYSDNEGHVIRYNVSVSTDKKGVIFLGEKIPGAPQYRLTYEDIGPGVVKILFEVAPPGKPEFTKYVEAKVHRKPSQ
jgi:hypothetical protein